MNIHTTEGKDQEPVDIVATVNREETNLNVTGNEKKIMQEVSARELIVFDDKTVGYAQKLLLESEHIPQEAIRNIPLDHITRTTVDTVTFDPGSHPQDMSQNHLDPQHSDGDPKFDQTEMAMQNIGECETGETSLKAQTCAAMLEEKTHHKGYINLKSCLYKKHGETRASVTFASTLEEYFEYAVSLTPSSQGSQITQGETNNDEIPVYAEDDEQFYGCTIPCSLEVNHGMQRQLMLEEHNKQHPVSLVSRTVEYNDRPDHYNNVSEQNGDSDKNIASSFNNDGTQECISALCSFEPLESSHMNKEPTMVTNSDKCIVPLIVKEPSQLLDLESENVVDVQEEISVSSRGGNLCLSDHAQNLLEHGEDLKEVVALVLQNIVEKVSQEQGVVHSHIPRSPNLNPRAHINKDETTHNVDMSKICQSRDSDEQENLEGINTALFNIHPQEVANEEIKENNLGDSSQDNSPKSEVNAEDGKCSQGSACTAHTKDTAKSNVIVEEILKNDLFEEYPNKDPTGVKQASVPHLGIEKERPQPTAKKQCNIEQFSNISCEEPIKGNREVIILDPIAKRDISKPSNDRQIENYLDADLIQNIRDHGVTVSITIKNTNVKEHSAVETVNEEKENMKNVVKEDGLNQGSSHKFNGHEPLHGHHEENDKSFDEIQGKYEEYIKGTHQTSLHGDVKEGAKHMATIDEKNIYIVKEEMESCQPTCSAKKNNADQVKEDCEQLKSACHKDNLFRKNSHEPSKKMKRKNTSYKSNSCIPSISMPMATYSDMICHDNTTTDQVPNMIMNEDLQDIARILQYIVQKVSEEEDMIHSHMHSSSKFEQSHSSQNSCNEGKAGSSECSDKPVQVENGNGQQDIYKFNNLIPGIHVSQNVEMSNLILCQARYAVEQMNLERTNIALTQNDLFEIDSQEVTTEEVKETDLGDDNQSNCPKSEGNAESGKHGQGNAYASHTKDTIESTVSVAKILKNDLVEEYPNEGVIRGGQASMPHLGNEKEMPQPTVKKQCNIEQTSSINCAVPVKDNIEVTSLDPVDKGDIIKDIVPDGDIHSAYVSRQTSSIIQERKAVKEIIDTKETDCKPSNNCQIADYSDAGQFQNNPCYGVTWRIVSKKTIVGEHSAVVMVNEEKEQMSNVVKVDGLHEENVKSFDEIQGKYKQYMRGIHQASIHRVPDEGEENMITFDKKRIDIVQKEMLEMESCQPTYTSEKNNDDQVKEDHKRLKSVSSKDDLFGSDSHEGSEEVIREITSYNSNSCIPLISMPIATYSDTICHDDNATNRIQNVIINGEAIEEVAHILQCIVETLSGEQTMTHSHIHSSSNPEQAHSSQNSNHKGKADSSEYADKHVRVGNGKGPQDISKVSSMNPGAHVSQDEATQNVNISSICQIKDTDEQMNLERTNIASSQYSLFAIDSQKVTSEVINKTDLGESSQYNSPNSEANIKNSNAKTSQHNTCTLDTKHTTEDNTIVDKIIINDLLEEYPNERTVESRQTALQHPGIDKGRPQPTVKRQCKINNFVSVNCAGPVEDKIEVASLDSVARDDLEHEIAKDADNQFDDMSKSRQANINTEEVENDEENIYPDEFNVAARQDDMVEKDTQKHIDAGLEATYLKDIVDCKPSTDHQIPEYSDIDQIHNSPYYGVTENNNATVEEFPADESVNGEDKKRNDVKGEGTNHPTSPMITEHGSLQGLHEEKKHFDEIQGKYEQYTSGTHQIIIPGDLEEESVEHIVGTDQKIIESVNEEVAISESSKLTSSTENINELKEDHERLSSVTGKNNLFGRDFHEESERVIKENASTNNSNDCLLTGELMVEYLDISCHNNMTSDNTTIVAEPPICDITKINVGEKPFFILQCPDQRAVCRSPNQLLSHEQKTSAHDRYQNSSQKETISYNDNEGAFTEDNKEVKFIYHVRDEDVQGATSCQLTKKVIKEIGDQHMRGQLEELNCVLSQDDLFEQKSDEEEHDISEIIISVTIGSKTNVHSLQGNLLKCPETLPQELHSEGEDTQTVNAVQTENNNHCESHIPLEYKSSSIGTKITELCISDSGVVASSLNMNASQACGISYKCDVNGHQNNHITEVRRENRSMDQPPQNEVANIHSKETNVPNQYEMNDSIPSTRNTKKDTGGKKEQKSETSNTGAYEQSQECFPNVQYHASMAETAECSKTYLQQPLHVSQEYRDQTNIEAGLLEVPGSTESPKSYASRTRPEAMHDSTTWKAQQVIEFDIQNLVKEISQKLDLTLEPLSAPLRQESNNASNMDNYDPFLSDFEKSSVILPHSQSSIIDEQSQHEYHVPQNGEDDGKTTISNQPSSQIHSLKRRSGYDDMVVPTKTSRSEDTTFTNQPSHDHLPFHNGTVTEGGDCKLSEQSQVRLASGYALVRPHSPVCTRGMEKAECGDCKKHTMADLAIGGVINGIPSCHGGQLDDQEVPDHIGDNEKATIRKACSMAELDALSLYDNNTTDGKHVHDSDIYKVGDTPQCQRVDEFSQNPQGGATKETPNAPVSPIVSIGQQRQAGTQKDTTKITNSPGDSPQNGTSSFRWRYAPSVDFDSASLIADNQLKDRPPHPLPQLATCSRPLRIGLSRRHRTPSLHPNWRRPRHLDA